MPNISKSLSVLYYITPITDMSISVPQNLCILKTLYVCMCITSTKMLFSACNSNSEALIESSSIAFAKCVTLFIYTALIINRIQATEITYLY